MRIVLGIEYDGHGFSGWQWQVDLRTVQDCLELALSKVSNEKVRVFTAGRTDTGVHALEQVVHFDTEAVRDERAWIMGVNSYLPDDVRVIWMKEALDGFHARYSAIARYYRYRIINRKMKSALQRKQMTWFYYPLDVEKMQAAANSLIGEHDFSSFRAQGCQSKSPMRFMHYIRVGRLGDEVFIDIIANAFVHHMVRNIAGVLMAIGSGKKPATWTEELLSVKDRKQGGVTAASDGLYLAGIYYPEKFGVPRHPLFKELPDGVKRFDDYNDKNES